ncbi:hypothetical protein EUX98_g7085 [Antrodiella citrinella]|uniref:Uncharacterized protein n=1 Tax=Antrodiella citrinella TaxID=2447956 RepID=A0A4S4MPX3_9APHY|nr:hypothetical protein EUX98_g7085 [Antrodiella citrinella]
MESFYWVLLRICLGYEGPGNPRILDGKDDETLASQKSITLLFDNEDVAVLGAEKRQFFGCELDVLEKMYLSQIGPYFEPLKDLLIQWRKVLYDSYEMYDMVEDGVIHKKILDLLDDHLEKGFSEPKNDINSKKVVVLTGRAKDIRRIKLSDRWAIKRVVKGDGTDRTKWRSSQSI